MTGALLAIAMLWCGAEDPDYVEGIAALEKGDFAGGLEKFETVIARDPKNADALYGRAFARISLGQIEQAIADFTAVLEVAPEYAKAYRNRGGAYFLKEKYQEAIQDLNRAIELNPRDDVAYYNRAAVRFEIDDYAAALEDADRAIAINSADAGHHVARAAALLALDRPTEVVTELTLWIDQGSGTDETYAFRSGAYLELDEPRKAIADCDAALRLDPENRNAQRNRANALMDLGLHSEARKEIDRYLRSNPKDAVAHWIRGAILGAQDEYALAAVAFTRVIELSPNEVSGWFGRGVTNLKLENYDAAIHDFELALKIDGTRADIYTYGAYALAESGRVQGGLFRLAQAVQHDPKNQLAWQLRGQLLYSMGDYGYARWALSKALALSPDNEIGLFHRALVSAALGDLDGSIGDLLTIARLRQHQVDSLLHEANTDLLNGSADFAVSHLTEGIKEYPFHAPLYLRRAVLRLLSRQLGPSACDLCRGIALQTINLQLRQLFDAVSAHVEYWIDQGTHDE